MNWTLTLLTVYPLYVSASLPSFGKEIDMSQVASNKRKFTGLMVPVALAALLGASVQVRAADVDADAAQALAKKNDCFKCHAVDKSKKGPSLKKIAAKYKGKADGEDKVIKNITTGPKVKLDDGSEEDHKIIDSKDPKALKNLAGWILAQ